MSKRSGQSGQVVVRNGKYVGRYYVDTPERRIRKAVVLGLLSEQHQPDAEQGSCLVCTSKTLTSLGSQSALFARFGTGGKSQRKLARDFGKCFLMRGTARVLADYLSGRTTGLVFSTRNGRPLAAREVVPYVLYPLCDSLGIKHGGMHALGMAERVYDR